MSVSTKQSSILRVPVASVPPVSIGYQIKGTVVLDNALRNLRQEIPHYRKHPKFTDIRTNLALGIKALRTLKNRALDYPEMLRHLSFWREYNHHRHDGILRLDIAEQLAQMAWVQAVISQQNSWRGTPSPVTPDIVANHLVTQIKNQVWRLADGRRY